MLKMIIVDDEKIIRETIYSIIDWTAIGIEVVGLCANGIDAFDRIMDEYPDIVITDIRMPGLSGLELIQKVHAAEMNVEFVILSGYNEFEFAQTAMKYGVQYYLLKPCNENDIIQAMKSVTAACQKKTADKLNVLLDELLQAPEPDTALQQKFFTLLSAQKDTECIKTLLIKLLMHTAKQENCQLSKVQLTEYLMGINSYEDCEALIGYAQTIMGALFPSVSAHKCNDCITKVQNYVKEHLSDSNLSLKWIAENYLYMNVDYLSKQFVKQTGSKFSTYLNTERVALAKQLLLSTDTDKFYEVAEQVGFGSNPQYFSQIFKKYTNMTPSAYLKMMGRSS